MQITLRPGQGIESAIKKLKKKQEADNFKETLERHQYFLTRNERNRVKRKKTARKFQKEKLKNVSKN